MAQNELLTVKEVCSLLKCSVPTLYRWAETRSDFPPKLKIGPNLVRYRKSDIDDFISGSGTVRDEVEKSESKTETA